MNNLPTPFVSVIIPVYNDPVRLKKCLQTLEEQTYPKRAYEVITVDNGSDESIEPIVAEFGQARATLETRPGSFNARNKGIELAKGEVFAFLDSDCIPVPNWIENGVTALLSVPNCGIVGGKVEFFFQDPDRPTAAELYDSIWHLNQKLYIEKFHFSATANLFTFKHVVEHVGRFPGNAKSLDDSDDMEWGQRVASFGYVLMYADDVRVTHPTRQSFDQLRPKVARIVQGTARLNRKGGFFSPILNRGFLIGLIPPVITTIRLRQKYKLTARELIEFLWIWCALRGIAIKERFKIMLWG